MFDQLIPSLREMHSTSDGFVETAQLKFNLRVPPGIDRVGLEESIGSLKADAQLRLDRIYARFPRREEYAVGACVLIGYS